MMRGGGRRVQVQFKEIEVDYKDLDYMLVILPKVAQM